MTYVQKTDYSRNVYERGPDIQGTSKSSDRKDEVRRQTDKYTVMV